MDDLLALHRDATVSPSATVLAGMLEASSDACWCMEFGVPVDLTTSDAEVVRQVFENEPRWRFCNAAMAALYLLPGDQSLTGRPVSEIFPRNAQNEAFILELLARGFEANGVPALDRRYDGVEIHVENDVRAHVHHGKMMRMFGIVRDVGKHYLREADLRERLAEYKRLINLLPDAVIGTDVDGRVMLANAAALLRLGRSQDGLVGQSLVEVLGGIAGAGTEDLTQALRSGEPSVRGWITMGGAEHAWILTRHEAKTADELALALTIRQDRVVA